MKLFLVIGLGTLLSGCMTLGRSFDVAKVKAIEIGKTTEADLKALFGEPYRTGIDDGDETATWMHYRLSLFGDQRTRDLYVRFQRDGKVKTYSFNSNVQEDQEQFR